MIRTSLVSMAATTVAAVSLVGFSSLPASAAATTEPSAQHGSLVASNEVSNVRPQSSTLEPDNRQQDIYGFLGDVTSDALKPGDMNRVVDQFYSPDAQRIKASHGFSGDYGPQLDNEMRAIRTTWKQKYGHSFSAKAAAAAIISEATVREGTAGNHNQLSREVMNSSSAGAPMLKANEKIAAVFIQSKNGKSLLIPLIQQDGKWRINVPDTENASALRQRLLSELQGIQSKTAQWPRSEAAAYRMVSNHVLRAIMNAPSPSASAMKTNVNSSQTASAAPAPAAPLKPTNTAAVTTTHHWWQFWSW